MPRSKIAGHIASDSQDEGAGSARADRKATTKGSLPARTHSDDDGHLASDTQGRVAVVGEGAAWSTPPVEEAPPRTPSKRRGRRTSATQRERAPTVAADRGQSESHSSFVSGDPLRDGHSRVEDRPALAVADDEGLDSPVDRTRGALVVEIREQWKQRVHLHRAEKSLTLRIKAMCRRLASVNGKDDKKGLAEADRIYKAMLGDSDHPLASAALMANGPLIEARAVIEKNRKPVEKRLEALAKDLPVAYMVEEIRGLGYGSLAAIIGEAGDLSVYSNPGKLWKRMGLALVNGRRQGDPGNGASADDWIAHGYSPDRRSVMFVIGDVLIKANKGEYRKLYNERKAYEIARDPEIKPIRAHRRAQRYMEKRLLRNLWKAWRAARSHETPGHLVPPADLPLAAD